MTKEEFNQYTHNYYQSGSLQKAPEALLHFLSEELEEKTVAGTELILYFFGRIAQRDACIVREYERLLDARLASKGVSVLLQLLQRVGDLHTRDRLKSYVEDGRYQAHREEITRVLDSNFPLFQNALLRPIRDGLDLDLLWMEFLVTGNRDAVVRIIEVLEWPDLLRGRLQQWLVFTTMRGPLSWRERRKVLALGDAEGLSIDLDQGKIITPEDLDCRCFLQGVQTNPERAKRIRKLLPFSLSEEELLHCGVRASAKWSLWSNAAQHSAVMEACVEEIRTTSLRARLSLLEIQAEAHLSNWRADAAEELLKEYVGLNPGNQDMVRRLEEAEVGEISFPSSKGKPPILARPALYVFLLGGARVDSVWPPGSSGLLRDRRGLSRLDHWVGPRQLPSRRAGGRLMPDLQLPVGQGTSLGNNRGAGLSGGHPSPILVSTGRPGGHLVVRGWSQCLVIWDRIGVYPV